MPWRPTQPGKVSFWLVPLVIPWLNNRDTCPTAQRILCGDLHEPASKGIGLPANGDGTFVHVLQQSRRGFERCSVDFVRQKNLRKKMFLCVSELVGVKIKEVGADVVALSAKQLPWKLLQNPVYG